MSRERLVRAVARSICLERFEITDDGSVIGDPVSGFSREATDAVKSIQDGLIGVKRREQKGT
jgi:hypothetical protein